jgi:hypothetical protein
MVFPIAGGNESKGYDVENSLRFNDDDSPRLTKTFSSEGDKRTNTFSCWVKRCNLTQSFIVAARHTSTGSDSHLKFDSSHRLAVKLRYQDSNDLLVTNRVFRDVSAWYHIVFMVDSTQATVSNRVKLYVNGVEETSFATDNRSNLGQNNTEAFGDDVEHAVAGRAESSTSEYSDLYIAETHFVNGSNLDATSFGEFDDNGVWIPKKYTGSYGTNGFFLEFKQTGTSANSSGIGADTSGNDNHFTPTNLAATDITEDTCTNNFATMNPIGTNNIATHSEGNTKLTTGGGASISGATIAMTAGKWYAEFTCTAKTSVNMNVGIVRADSFDGDNQMDEGNNVGYAFQNTGDIYHGGANESYGASWAVDDVIGIAFNADNLNVEFFKNGVGQGNYTRITSENSGGDWIMCVGEGQASGTTATFECNFGNPPSSVSSGNTDGKYGNFEYAPPSGYYALCTKRLAEFG